MLRAELGRGSQEQHLVLREARHRDHVGEGRLAPGHGARLVEDDRVDLVGSLQGVAGLDQDAVFGALSDPDHQRRWCRQTEGTRTGDHQHCHRGDHRINECRCGPKREPGHEGEDRPDHHRRNEIARHPVDGALDRRLRSLGVADHLDDLGQHRVLPDPGGAEAERAGLVDCGPDHRVALHLLDRDRLTGHHGLIDRRPTGDHDPVDRDLLPGPDHDGVIDDDFFDRHVDLDTAPDHPCGLRLESDQLLEGFGGLGAGPYLQCHPQNHQRRDDGGHIEEHVPQPFLGEQAGKEERRRRVQPRCADAAGDEGVHVGLAVLERRPRTGEELRSRPQQDRQGQHRHRPPDDVERRGTLLGYAGEQLGIGEVDDGKRHDGSEPELPQQGAIQQLAGGHLDVALLFVDPLSRRPGRIPGGGDDLGEHFVRYVLDVDDRLLGGKVHPGIDDAGSRGQRVLDGCGAPGTGHPVNGYSGTAMRFPAMGCAAGGCAGAAAPYR